MPKKSRQVEGQAVFSKASGIPKTLQILKNVSNNNEHSKELAKPKNKKKNNLNNELKIFNQILH